MRLIAPLFFLSGAAALLYQVVWQRALFAIYGVNIESVTVIVTAFMLGLGVGSLAGGVLSKRPGPLLGWFAAVELGLGLFGAFSMPLFHWIGERTLRMSALPTALVTFGLVLVPTLLMGATLPLLVAYMVRKSGNVGLSVGMLYSVNTIGSAFASVAAVLAILGWAGQMGATWVAAALNFVTSAAVYGLHRREKRA